MKKALVLILALGMIFSINFSVTAQTEEGTADQTTEVTEDEADTSADEAVVDEPITEEGVALQYETDSDGIRSLVECPIVGGIDLGSPEETAASDPTPQEIKEAAAKERKERANRKKAKAATTNGKPKQRGDSKRAAVTSDEELEGKLVLDSLLLPSPSEEVIRLRLGKLVFDSSEIECCERLD